VNTPATSASAAEAHPRVSVGTGPGERPGAVTAAGPVLSRARSWVQENRPRFGLPALADRGFVDALKPLGELALTGQVLAERLGDPVGEAWIGWAWAQTHGGDLLARVLEEHHELVGLASLYTVFHRAGLRSSKFEQRLAWLLGLDAVRHLEFVPWRRLELARNLDELGMCSPWVAEESLAQTWLACTPEPWVMSESTGYSLTHTVFYATDFGHRPHGLGDELRGHLATWLPVWVRLFAGQSNLDLVAELGMAAQCVDLPGVEEEVVRRLSEAQHGDGMVPGPVRPREETASVDAPARRFAQNYHTTLVALMAAAMAGPLRDAPQ
jgi:hypothetical protein